MTSVRNHQLLLSGNKYIFWITLALVISACSPKVATVSNKPVKKPADNEKQQVKTPERAPQKATEVRVSTISMLLPFDLDQLSSVKGYSKAALTKANIAVDYYQGFKLALDSLAADGYNFKLQVYDTKDEVSQARNLANNPKIRNSDLIVGPVFPVGIKVFGNAIRGVARPMLSPLSPAPPSDFANPDLITAVPPLEYHAWSAAGYIRDNYKPKKVFILKSGYSEDNKYSLPFKRAIDSLGRKRIRIVEVNVVRGNLKGLIPQLSLREENIFLMPAVNQAFLLVTLRSLDDLAKKYPVTLFGHPNWEKFSFLRPELLQRLKTHITSTGRIDYKSEETRTFVRTYRKTYKNEPTEYAFKGFDEGMYFGQVLASGKEGLKKLNTNDAEALHNDFNFEKKPGIGWVNTHVNILKYVNFELKKVE
jgi:ABC-type branched-subunit amino acid transport system substrate-binding protein